MNIFGVKRELAKAQQEFLDVLRESRDLLETAGKQAEQMMKQTNVLSQDVQRDIEVRLSLSAQKVEEKTTEILNSIFVQSQEAIDGVMRALDKAGKKGLSELQQQTSAALQKTQEELLAGAAAYQEKIHRQLEEFARLEQEKIRKQLAAKLPHIVQEAAGRAISLHDHERLVEDALTRAAAEIVWYDKP